jgi:hypothetical protein
VVLIVESICGQSFAYAREVEEERLSKIVKLDKKAIRDTEPAAKPIQKIRSKTIRPMCSCAPFSNCVGMWLGVPAKMI